MWWHLPPAMLKGWFDRVWSYGAAYTSTKRFEHGRFAGKRAMLSVTVGTSRETYMRDGRSGDIDLMLWPVNFNLAYMGYTVLDQFVAYGVEAGLRYSEPSVVEARLARIAEAFRSALRGVERSSPSTARRTGARMGGSCRRPRSIHPSSAGSSISISDEGRQIVRAASSRRVACRRPPTTKRMSLWQG
jgi:hypothetical protein